KPGRGLNLDKEHILIAHASGQDIAQVCVMADEQGWQQVPQLSVLPAHILLHELELSATPGIPIARGGAELSTLTWDPESSRHLLAVGSQGCGKSSLIRTIVTGLTIVGREKARLVFFDLRRTHLGLVPEDMLAAYCATSTAVHNTIKDMVAT